jgi:hypothetical protein
MRVVCQPIRNPLEEDSMASSGQVFEVDFLLARGFSCGNTTAFRECPASGFGEYCHGVYYR